MGCDDPAQPVGMDADIAESLAVWGVAATAMPAAAPAFEVMRANAAALDAWFACETQWRLHLGPTGRWIWTGLDYPAVAVVLGHLAPDDPTAVFADLQLMERSALATWDEIS